MREREKNDERQGEWVIRKKRWEYDKEIIGHIFSILSF